MTIKYSKKFKKQFQYLKKNEQKRFFERLEIFVHDPTHPQLNRHSLKGKYAGLNSINVGGDLRALYIEKGKDLVLFKLIGTHGQLYG